MIHTAAVSLSKVVKSVEEDRPNVLACAYELEMKLLGADGGDSLRRYLESIGSTTLYPLLTGWLEKLEVYRTDLSGFQSYWAELDRYAAEMFSFLRNYDAILCPVYTQPALPHGASILDLNFRGFSHTMAYTSLVGRQQWCVAASLLRASRLECKLLPGLGERTSRWR